MDLLDSPVLGLVAVTVTRMVPFTVMGEEFAPLTWVMTGEGGVLLDGHGLQLGLGEDSDLGIRVRHRVTVARVTWVTAQGHPGQGDLELGIGRPVYPELDQEGGASPGSSW